MATKGEIDRQAHLWSLGLGLTGAALLLAAAAVGASQRARTARIGGAEKRGDDA